jgi:hypothetical protein
MCGFGLELLGLSMALLVALQGLPEFGVVAAFVVKVECVWPGLVTANQQCETTAGVQ